MTKIVFEMIAFGFQIIEVFVLDFPAAPSGFHQIRHILFADEVTGNEGSMKGDLSFFVGDGDLYPVHLDAIFSIFQRYLVDIPVGKIAMLFASPLGLFHLLKLPQLLKRFKLFV